MTYHSQHGEDRWLVENMPDGKGRTSEPPKISKLGKRLREISDRAIASGVEILSVDEIHDRLRETRGGGNLRP
jgi:hypothetical protein